MAQEAKGSGWFEADEAEGLVRELRGHLRRAREYEEQGESKLAAAHERRSNELLGTLVQRLGPRIDRSARSLLTSASEEDIEELVRGIVCSLCSKLKDLTPKQQIFEQRFHIRFTSTVIDAVRHFSRRERRGRPIGCASLDDEVETSEDGAPVRLGDTIEEERSIAILDRRLGRHIRGRLLARLPSAAYLQVLSDWLDDRTWPEIATRAGISERTARNYHKHAIERLKRIVSSPEELEGLR